jgi:hypothetical protein
MQWGRRPHVSGDSNDSTLVIHAGTVVQLNGQWVQLMTDAVVRGVGKTDMETLRRYRNLMDDVVSSFPKQNPERGA